MRSDSVLHSEFSMNIEFFRKMNEKRMGTLHTQFLIVNNTICHSFFKLLPGPRNVF